MKLVKYNEVSEQQYLDYISEWESTGEVIVPSSSRRRDRQFTEIIEKWDNDTTEEAYNQGFVPSTLYFMIDEYNKIVGAIHLRHELNDRLLQNGGHIGYGIRPSERRKGCASLMLNTLLKEIRKQGYDKVLITCDDINIGSAKTIEKNGGKDYELVVFEGDLTRKYWINL